MRRLVPVLTVLFFFASCSFIPQIEKRHYRNGFYIEKGKEKNFSFKQNKKADSVSTIFIPEKLIPKKLFRQKKTVPVSLLKINSGKKEKIAVKKNCNKITVLPAIVLPKKEPINKKAKTAVILLIIAKLLLGISFLALLLSWLDIFFLIAGIAALFAILSMLFAIRAKKIIAQETGISKELGEKEADFVIKRAGAGLIGFVFIILLAVIVNTIQKARGN
jgi:hypothetical protein